MSLKLKNWTVQRSLLSRHFHCHAWCLSPRPETGVPNTIPNTEQERVCLKKHWFVKLTFGSFCLLHILDIIVVLTAIHRLFENSLPVTNDAVVGAKNHDDEDGRPEVDSGLCQPYHGVVCSQYIKNMSIYLEPGVSQDMIEQKIQAAFTVVATSPDVSAQCHRFAIPSLCFAAFPLCDDFSEEPKPRKASFNCFCHSFSFKTKCEATKITNC